MDNSRGEPLHSYPTTKVYVPVDKEAVTKNGTVLPGDSVLDQVRFDLPQRMLMKNDIVMLNIIASNNWKRPIYFSAPINELGFGNYLRKDGMAYRLVPIARTYPENNWTMDQAMRQVVRSGTQIRQNNSEFMFETLMNKIEFGGANIKGVYFDEENRSHILNLRALFAEAAGNLADKGEKDKAIKLIDKVEAGIDPENLPYAMVSRNGRHNQTGLIYLEACYKAGKNELAEKIRLALRKDLEEQARYYKYMETEKPEYYGAFEQFEAPFNQALLAVLGAIEQHYAPQQTQTQAPGEGPTTITNSPKRDSSGRPDSGGR
jgi:hypothetical protein